jgi:hypothetical protein
VASNRDRPPNGLGITYGDFGPDGRPLPTTESLDFQQLDSHTANEGLTVESECDAHTTIEHSTVALFEQRLSARASIAPYNSGVRADASFSIDTDGTYIGFGYPGAPRADNKASTR